MALDTLKVADSATKADLDAVRVALKTEIAELRNETRRSELRLEARLEAIKAETVAVKADVLNRMLIASVLGAFVVNIVAGVGAVFAVAKLAGH